MRRTHLQNLETVTEAMFQQKFQSLRPVLEAEARIHNQLSRLDEQMHQACRDSTSSDGYKVSGADILWNGWESATRRQLNMELARLRSQKLDALSALRQAFGRKTAVQTLSVRLQDADRQARIRKQLEQ